MKYTLLKKVLAGTLTLAVCVLSGCSGNPDNREDPLSGHNVDALLPFRTRVPEAAATATPTPVPGSTTIVSVTQGWQNEAGPFQETATPAPAATRLPQVYSRLEQGDEGEEVLRLQNRLKELGYLSANADGKFGANTKTAVKLFQKALGLSQTGVATISLQEKLFLSSAPVYVPTATATVPPSSGASTQYQALVRGDKSAEVKALQSRLIELGYLSGGADGQFGANTEKAVKAFQAQLGLSQTGVASAVLQQQLFSDNAPYAPVQATVRPTEKPTQAPADDLGYQQLEPGDSGEQVVRMQNRLKQLGYFTGTVSGNYYKETTAAVQLFQKAAGLSQTGIATSTTLTRLYASNAPVYSAATVAPTQAAGYTTLSRGSKGTEVRNLQKRLIALGYMSTTADGDYGSRTENAVKLFQQAVGHTVNGVASVGLQNLLFSSSAPVYVPTTTPTPTSIPVQPTPAIGYRQLEPGDTGDAVRTLQSRLKQLGFFSGVIGGNYLTKTTDAVRLFQAAIGHAETGIATPEMQEILFSDAAPDYSSVESEYVTLEKLDSGVQVLYLQQRLIELGWLTGKADGDFGSNTEKAVMAFQKQAGLNPTGKATVETQTLLFSAYAPYAPVPTQAPTQVPTSVPTPIPTQIPTPVPTAEPQTGYSTLRYGDSSSRVADMQRRLKELGYFDGEIGGNFLAKTETAVKLFQATIGYQPDGVATSDLQSLLFSSSAPYYDGTGFIPLSKGDGGPAVKNLQNRLIELGYLTGTADGDFGGATETAVKRFQQTVGYYADGAASVEIQNLLFSGSAPSYRPAATEEPVVTPPEEDSYHVLSFGDEGEAVYDLQLRLIELGYLTENATGNYRAKTEEAVRRFQQAVGYSGDGVATAELQELLYSPSAPYYVPAATSVPEPTKAPEMDPEPEIGYRDLFVGDDGNAVYALQKRLIELGYLTGTADGDYGNATANAVKRFQQAIGYSQTGDAGIRLQEILFSSNAPYYVPTETPEPDNSGYPTLSQGDTGDAVKKIQRRLKELGFFDGDIGGNYLTKTEAAVKRFQKALGLSEDGIATPELQEMLFSSDAPYYSEPSAPQPTEPAQPDRLRELEPGDNNDQVKAMQSRLIELGWLPEGNATGYFGDLTANSLNGFLYRMGLPADGIATVEALTFLYADDAPAYVEYIELLPGEAYGEEVLNMQLRLIELGYLEDTFENKDSVYGPALQNALIQLQLNSGVLPELADGIATIELQTFLFSGNADLYSLILMP